MTTDESLSEPGLSNSQKPSFSHKSIFLKLATAYQEETPITAKDILVEISAEMFSTKKRVTEYYDSYIKVKNDGTVLYTFKSSIFHYIGAIENNYGELRFLWMQMQRNDSKCSFDPFSPPRSFVLTPSIIKLLPIEGYDTAVYVQVKNEAVIGLVPKKEPEGDNENKKALDHYFLFGKLEMDGNGVWFVYGVFVGKG